MSSFWCAHCGAETEEVCETGIEDQVREFMLAIGTLHGRETEKIAYLPLSTFARISMLQEEIEELDAACAAEDFVEYVDALGDILYLVHGGFLEIDVDPKSVVDEIHRSNMTKVGSPFVDGKLQKGLNYSPPDLVRVLSEQGFPLCECLDQAQVEAEEAERKWEAWEKRAGYQRYAAVETEDGTFRVSRKGAVFRAQNTEHPFRESGIFYHLDGALADCVEALREEGPSDGQILAAMHAHKNQK